VLLSHLEPRPVWLLIRSKPKQERIAAESLEGRGVAVYCPRILEPRTHLRAARTPVPLFPSYLFARCVLRESFYALAYCPGLVGPVRFGERFAAAEEEDVAFLREKEKGRGFLVPSSVRKPLMKGSRVAVLAGPFRGFEGVVEQYLPSQNRVRLLLEVVSGKWRAQMGAEFVRVA
jgi:transcription antitermination factor NusG